MKRILLMTAVAGLAAVAQAGFEGGLPDATHAWGMNDEHAPQPLKVDCDFGGVPTDALVFENADGIDRKLAADCQLHFCCRKLDRFTYFGTPLSPVATPGADGWIAVDAVLHAGDGGHAGYATLFVNGLLAGETPLKSASAAKPLVIAGTEVCRLWARPSPPPWAEKLCGAYVDRKAVAEQRRAMADRLIVVLGGMRERLPGSRWGEGKWGFARRRMGVVVTAYAYCRDAKFEKIFREECDAYAALALADRDRKTYANENNLLTIARFLYPLLHDGVIDEKFPLWKVIRDFGVKPWGGR